MAKKQTLLILILLIVAFSACTLPATKATQTSLNNPSYTAAAETINAQLTALALPSGTPGVAEAQALPNTPSSPELAATGTALAAAIEPALQGTLETAQTPQGTEAQPAAETPGSLETPAAVDTTEATATPAATETPAAETPAATQTPAPTTTAAPTRPVGTLDASKNPATLLGAPDWKEVFANGANWPIYNDDHVEMSLKNGALEMTALYNDKWESWMLTSAELENFYLELKATPGKCAGYDRYGLLARAPNAAQAYLFGFTCDGRYSLRIWNGQNFVMLIPWTKSDAILKGPDQENVLGIWAEGSLLRLYANGKYLAEIEDETFSLGAFGVSIAAFNTPGFTTRYTEMSYWELP